mmetsp:Transcript_11091/g.14607  ORF Transcript_11091/g.14607 Transcript_11091/m.14607 type:complete len:89 (+) Transcript_11091:241-507(+)
MNPSKIDSPMATPSSNAIEKNDQCPNVSAILQENKLTTRESKDLRGRTTSAWRGVPSNGCGLLRAASHVSRVTSKVNTSPALPLGIRT